MKRKMFIGALFATLCIATNAQITLRSYDATHKDSCWHFTLDYDTPKIASNDGMLVVTHICTPDTCVSSSARHIQGRKYSKRYARIYGTAPLAQKNSRQSCTLAVPEKAVCDTVYAITYCEYSTRNSTEFLCDTVAICLPEPPPMSCHRVKDKECHADTMTKEHPYIKNIRYYTPLDKASVASAETTPHIVRYTTNSDKLNPQYLDNITNIEDMMSLIDEILADSGTSIEAVQIIGYTSPDGSENGATSLGRARAIAMREHIHRHHGIPDSIFEVADGRENWNMVYDNIREIDPNGGEELIERLKREPDAYRREKILKRFEDGKLYTELLEKHFPAHRIACCTGIYYSNTPDSTAMTLNRIVDELAHNPAPDYDRLMKELKQYKDDPRVLNLEGVIEYRQHHRHSAEQAFIKAAQMGDEQASVNLKILEMNKER